MSTEEQNFIKTIYVDKANKKIIAPIVLIIISILTYIFPLILGDFDFGIIFEGSSFVFMIVSKFYMSKYIESKAMICNIISMLFIGWILVYDILLLISNIINGVFIYYFGETLPVFIIILLFTVHTDLYKANNPEKLKENTDWFYENYNKK